MYLKLAFHQVLLKRYEQEKEGEPDESGRAHLDEKDDDADRDLYGGCPCCMLLRIR